MRSMGGKYEAAAGVIQALERREVLCIGAFAIGGGSGDPWAWGTQDTDELDLLIRHEDLGDFMDAMSRADYVLARYDQDEDTCVEVDRGQVESAILRMPVSPENSYADSSCIGQPGRPQLWVNFHTTTRHGRLMLVDLAGWFHHKQEGQVVEGPDFAPTVYRPPLWAMLLWQAAEVTCGAAERDITEHDVHRLRALAEHPDLDWSLVRSNAEAYDAEYRNRLSRSAAAHLLANYGARLGISPPGMDRAERQYGALYELSHALKAVRDYGGTVDAGLWAEVLEPITSDDPARSQPRKLWAYPGVVGNYPVPPPDFSGGRLGIARADFTIHEQIQNYPNADFDMLLSRGLITLLIPAPDKTAPPHGPWAKSTKDDMDSIFP